MGNKNIIIGNGERLTKPIPPPKGGAPKKYPYTYEEARQRLTPRIRSVIKTMRKMSDNTKVRGHSVIRMTMHPAFLAKSYYPDKLIEHSGLESLGSKEVVIKPEKTQKQGEPLEEVSACYYLSCTEGLLEAMLNHIEGDDFNQTTQKQLSYIEDFNFFEPEDKIKHLDNKTKRLEVVLHARKTDGMILESFYDYVQALEGEINTENSLSVGGLTFLSVRLPHQRVHKLAEFSMLRAVRSMPKLRIYEPQVTRMLNKNIKINLPVGPAINQDIRVAIFDGGIGPITNFAPWVTETDLTGAPPHADMLQHGADVTSTFLFGRVDEIAPELDLPFANVDHYRVLSSQTNPADYDLLSILKMIESVLDSNDYDFVNLSLGPDIPIEDDDVHAWTSLIDSYQTDGRMLVTVAVGNKGELGEELGRIQPPSDMVNSLSVGAADSPDDNWSRAFYSCYGLGRSPGKIKPDGVMFGGTNKEPFVIYSPWDNIKAQMGTSFSSPLAMRTSVKIKSALDYQLNAVALKALMIHHADPGVGHDKSEVGWGRFPEQVETIITCGDNEATIIYQGELLDGGWLRAPVPLPDIQYKGNIILTATFCYATESEPEHLVSYTKSGLEVIFRKNQQSKDNTKSFFSKKQFQSEMDARHDAHKWETVLHNTMTFRKTSLDKPCFDIVYRSREGGGSVKEDLPALPYVLIVTIKANNSPELYTQVLQQYRVLQTIRLRQEVQLDTL